ncbi:MAG: glycosyltransferase, partial [Bacteroidia bacterium]
MIIKKDKKKVSLIHCGHEFAYLYGLLSGFYKKGFFHLDIIDSVRPPDEAHGFNDEHDFRFFSFLGGTKKNPILKGLRWGAYYMRLIPYLLFNKSYIVHIEWINSQFSGFEEIMLPFIIKKIRHQKLVYTVHDVSSKLLLKKTGEDYDVKPNRTKLFFYNSVDVFIVHNEFTQKILIDFGVASEKIQILKHGLNIFAPFTGKGKAEVRKELKINNDDKVVLFFGNISPYKNIEALIDAVSVVKKTHKEVKLLIVGNFRKGLQQYKKQIDDKCDELLKGSVIRELKFIN